MRQRKIKLFNALFPFLHQNTKTNQKPKNQTKPIQTKKNTTEKPPKLKKEMFLWLHFMREKRKNFKTVFLGGPDETELSETAVGCPFDLKSS